MKKLIITCPNCTKKMKISNKIAKYKCPNCSKIYKFNLFKFLFLNIENFFINLTEKISRKFNNFKNTYKYMKQLKANMKNDPNWSNYRRQQQEEEKLKKSNKSSFKDKIKTIFK